MAEVLREKLDQMKGGRTRREIIAEALLTRAENGDVPAARTVIERVDGRSPFVIVPGDRMRSRETDPRKVSIILANLARVRSDLAALVHQHDQAGRRCLTSYGPPRCPSGK